jgi:maltooligosyltrehalose synthase
MQQAVARAQRNNPALSREVFAFVQDMLLLNYPAGAGDDERAAQQRFVGKFQQVTAPVMAKGLEDTAFYRYHRLLSLNEVGNDADRFGVSPDELHRVNQERQAKWPWALSALSTHDTKRSEDVRARLNVLSELPEEWQACLKRWSDVNAQYRQEIDEAPVPDASVEYLIYQTLLGAWPLEPDSLQEYAAFVERIQAYMLKALHEAKVHTSWINPNDAYDEDDHSALAQELLTHKQGGRIKLYVSALALHCRRKNPGLFAVGEYIPAQVLGAQAVHVFAFRRRQGDREAVVAVPRLITRLLGDSHEAALGEAVWQDTRLRIPGINPQQTWHHVFTGEPVRMATDDGQPTLAVADLMAQFPVALLVAQP